MKRLVLLSGGIDSTTCLAIAAERSHNDPHEDDALIALSVNYGQRHKWEIDSAAAVAKHYDATHLIINIPNEIFQGKNAGFLINKDQEVPDISYAEISGVSPSFVPFRNGNLLSVATSIAFTHECSEVWAGMHADDAANWAYPDCTPEFLGGMAAAIYVGTYYKVRLVTPLMYMFKNEVVREGLALSAPYELTRSCYAETELSCGKCPTCYSRLDAFSYNTMQDPIEYHV